MNNPLKGKVDVIDALSLPFFAATIIAEQRALAGSEQRDLGDMDHLTKDELADSSGPPDPLVPIGYEPRDTRASLTMLAGNVAVNLVASIAYGKINKRLYDRRLVNIPSAAAQMGLAMVAWDLCYYWSHRWQHERRLFWANHVTHHSSERYNLSTALRQPWSGFLLAWCYMPMPILGIAPKAVAKAGQLNLLYQYWIHTEAIDKLPEAAESVLNTPSHHRVHHGANPQYLDKNYGGILIIWDKMFGTFEPEHRRIKYGLTKNIKTFNPVKIGYHEFADIVRDVRRARGWRNKLGHVWKHPGWQPDDHALAA